MTDIINLNMECPGCGKDLYLNVDTMSTFCKDPYCEYHYTTLIDNGEFD